MKTSLPGYLGPWHPEDLLISLANYPFGCHQTIHDSTGDTTHLEDPDDMFSDPRLEACAGAAIFLNNKFEISRLSFTRLFQDDMKTVSEIIKESVFRTRAEFIAHHGTRFGVTNS